MPYHFYNTISQLRQNEELVLYDRVLHFSEEDEQLVKDFLKIEYETESLNYPFTPPSCNAAAALWGAKTVYTACQLILYRENKEAELPLLLPVYNNEMDAAAILSADLCLRFLPQALQQTKNIDPDDALIAVLENHLQQWHYSGIGYVLNAATVNFDTVFANECMQQLYIDRVIQKKDMQRAMLPLLQKKITAAMGIYSATFWKELNSDKTHE
ncbi:hypothetical protein [Ferruginibacter sp.]|nr:hypothetical protein [Ferruginibacter sp.]